MYSILVDVEAGQEVRRKHYGYVSVWTLFLRYTTKKEILMLGEFYLQHVVPYIKG